MDSFAITGDLPVTNPQGEIVAKVVVSLQVVAVVANHPPQYTGPTTMTDLVVNVGRQLQGIDPDAGDTIRWTIDPANEADATVSVSGLFTPKRPIGTPGNPATIIVHMDDGHSDTGQLKL